VSSAGLTFEMYVQEDLTDTRLEVLSGEIELSLKNGSIYQLRQGNTIPVKYRQTAARNLTIRRL